MGPVHGAFHTRRGCIFSDVTFINFVYPGNTISPPPNTPKTQNHSEANSWIALATTATITRGRAARPRAPPAPVDHPRRQSSSSYAMARAMDGRLAVLGSRLMEILYSRPCWRIDRMRWPTAVSRHLVGTAVHSCCPYLLVTL